MHYMNWYVVDQFRLFWSILPVDEHVSTYLKSPLKLLPLVILQCECWLGWNWKRPIQQVQIDLTRIHLSLNCYSSVVLANFHLRNMQIRKMFWWPTMWFDALFLHHHFTIGVKSSNGFIQSTALIHRCKQKEEEWLARSPAHSLVLTLSNDWE